MSRSDQASALSTVAGLAKLSKQSGLIMPLLAGDSGSRNIHLTTLEIRNKLLSWILKNFSADVALQFQQSTWKKYAYTTQDTDVTAALKTLFNLLYQAHIANTLDISAKRHQHWPLYEILELSRCQNLLKSILREDQWRETFTIFSGYWQGFEKFFEPSEKNAAENQKDDSDQETIIIDNLVADLENDLEEQKGQPAMVPGDVVIEKNYVDKVKERMDKIADFSKGYWHSENGLMRVYYITRIYLSRNIGEDADDQSGTLQKLAKLIAELFIYLDHVEARLGVSDLFSNQLAKIILALAPDDSKPFFKILRAHLDIHNNQICVKHRLAATEKKLARLGEKITAASPLPLVSDFYQICLGIHAERPPIEEDLAFFTRINEFQVVDYLASIGFFYEGMDAEEFVKLTKDLVLGTLTSSSLARQHKKTLLYFLDQFNRESNRVRGLQATKMNFENLYAQLTKNPIKSDLDIERHNILMYLEVAFRDAVLSIARFSTKLPPEYKELHRYLELLSTSAEKLQGLAVSLAKVFSAKEIEDLATELQTLKQGYAQLTETVPLTCRKFFQENIQRIFDGIAQLQQISPQAAKACQQSKEAEEKSHLIALGHALSAVAVSVQSLSSEIKTVPTLTPPSRLQSMSGALSGALQTVTKHWPFSASSAVSPSVVEDEAKEDFLEYLAKLQDNLAKLTTLIDSGADEGKRSAVINSLSRNIFDLRRLAGKVSLGKSPVLAKAWHNLNCQINLLRERDSLFARAIAANGSEVLIEDSAWCEQWDLSHPVPGLAVPTPGQVLETIYGMAGTIHNKLAGIIDKQSPDSLYFKALHQPRWQKFVFNQQETTETYTLKLFFNLLWQIREATNPEIADWKVSRYVPGAEWVTRLSKLPIQELAALLDELPAFLANSGIADLAQQALGLIKFLMSGVPGRASSPADALTIIAASADNPTLSPVHALAHSGIGLVATDVPKIMKMIAGAARIKVNVAKIKSDQVNIPAQESGKIAYTQSESKSLGSRLKNFGRNLGIAIWNNVILPISSVSLIRREKREIVQEVVGMVRAPELANKAAFVETSQQLRKVLVALDGLADQSGLQEHKLWRDKVAEKATSEAKSSDVILRNNFFASEWKIIGGQPFLIERMTVIQQRLDKSQIQLQELRQKIPVIMIKFTQAMKSNYLDEELFEELKENRTVIISFLQSYAREKQAKDQAVLAKLSERHAGQLQELQDSGESPRQIEKMRKFLAEQYNNIRISLLALSAIRSDQIDDLFDSVVKFGIEIFDLPKFNLSELNGISDELAEYIASHERGIRSAQHLEMNLQNSLKEKQSTLHKVFRTECDNLYSQSLQFDIANYPHSSQLKYFFADFHQFVETYRSVQEYTHCLPDAKLRLDIKLLCDKVSRMATVPPTVRDLALETSQQEFHYFVKQLLNAIIQQNDPSEQLIAFSNALSELTVLTVEKLQAFAPKITVILQAYPQLKQPMQNLMAMFPGLTVAGGKDKRNPQAHVSLTKNSAHLFHRASRSQLNQDKQNAPSLHG